MCTIMYNLDTYIIYIYIYVYTHVFPLVVYISASLWIVWAIKLADLSGKLYRCVLL